MKRWEIKQILKSVSDAQLRKSISSLGLSVDDGISYTQQETERILSLFNPQQPNQPSQSNPSNQPKQAAIQAKTEAQEQLRSATKNCLDNAQAFLETTRQQRSGAALALGKEIANLLDPEIFLAESLLIAAQEVQQSGKLECPFYESIDFPIYHFPASSSLPGSASLLSGS